jgi:hypothetical protein
MPLQVMSFIVCTFRYANVVAVRILECGRSIVAILTVEYVQDIL